MPNRAHRAEEESLVDFLADYTPVEAKFALSTGDTPLLRAMLNADLLARVGIAERLLDDGADAAVTLGSAKVANRLRPLVAAGATLEEAADVVTATLTPSVAGG